MILSYAQNGEDVVLARVFVDQPTGFYVDIGACHPDADSVTLHFYERGWRGVNVEPDHVLHAAFLTARPRDVNICAAIGRMRGQMAFHPTGTRGHGTLDTTLASDRSAGRPVERVPTMLLSDVIDCYGADGGQIDFLKIDVEGWEAEVIASGDWTRHRPRVLVIEAVDDKGCPTHAQWEPDLLGAGYQFALFDGLNRFYCRDEDAGRLLPRLVAPANVLDGWRRADDMHAHETAARLQADAALGASRTAEAEDRSNALGMDLEEVRATQRAAESRCKTALLEVERLAVDAARERVEMAADLARAQAEMAAGLARTREEVAANVAHARAEAARLAVDAVRARTEAAAALRREEAAEASMAGLEMDLIRRDAEIAAGKMRVSVLEAEAAAAAARIAIQETEITERVAALAEAEQAIQAAHRQRTLQVGDAEAWLAAVRTSTSWRVTRPFRVSARLLLGIRGRR